MLGIFSLFVSCVLGFGLWEVTDSSISQLFLLTKIMTWRCDQLWWLLSTLV